MKRIVAGLLAVTMTACSYAPTKPVLKTWVHIFGCPSSTRDHLGPQNVILVFSNGGIVILRIDKATDGQREELRKYIGDLDGQNIVYQCGTQS